MQKIVHFIEVFVQKNSWSEMVSYFFCYYFSIQLLLPANQSYRKRIMKKLFCILLVGIVAVCFVAKRSSQNSKVSTLLLYNIEALAASSEITKPVRCLGTGSVDCPASQEKVEMYFIGYSLEE